MDTSIHTNRDQPSTSFDVDRIRRDFPILAQTINGKPLIYLDNAASSQKPHVVIDTLTRYYREDHANIHRAVHALSVRATEAYEAARVQVQRFVGAERSEEIVFVRGATEGINLIAQTYGRSLLRQGDEIVISTMEHHSNIVPWQILCEQTGAVLRVAPINDDGELMLDEYEKLLGSRTKLVSITHVSNALGTINPLRQIVTLAHDRGIGVVVDGAQAVPHMKVDVRELDCEFYTFSSHKMFGPTGVGAVYGKLHLLEAMPPYQGGGEMIKSVTFEKTTYNDVPHKFEAGTPNIAGVIGFAAAVHYLDGIGFDRIAAYEHELLSYATEMLSKIPEIRLIGTAAEKAAVLSFVVDGVHAHDIGTILDSEGIAVRTGHHCAQPVMDRFAVPATARASLAFYNTPAEIDAMVVALRNVIKVFSG
ncbi:MAG: cysteine desulfurase [Planctomycetes bacterium]|nr:cysteine desulfurase [Planctomycetota bacterium]